MEDDPVSSETASASVAPTSSIPEVPSTKATLMIRFAIYDTTSWISAVDSLEIPVDDASHLKRTLQALADAFTDPENVRKFLVCDFLLSLTFPTEAEKEFTDFNVKEYWNSIHPTKNPFYKLMWDHKERARRVQAEALARRAPVSHGDPAPPWAASSDLPWPPRQLPLSSMDIL